MDTLALKRRGFPPHRAKLCRIVAAAHAARLGYVERLTALSWRCLRCLEPRRRRGGAAEPAAAQADRPGPTWGAGPSSLPPAAWLGLVERGHHLGTWSKAQAKRSPVWTGAPRQVARKTPVDWREVCWAERSAKLQSSKSRRRCVGRYAQPNPRLEPNPGSIPTPRTLTCTVRGLQAALPPSRVVGVDATDDGIVETGARAVAARATRSQRAQSWQFGRAWALRPRLWSWWWLYTPL